MPNVVRTDIDALNAVLTVTILKEDYLPKVKKDMKTFTQRSPMKGFRPGKTPPKLVETMYGTEFVMEAVNKTLQETVGNFLVNRLARRSNLISNSIQKIRLILRCTLTWV
jgi:trigger factor